MTLSPEERDRMLEMLATGDREPSDPEVTEAFASDPTLAAEWGEMRAMQEALEAAGARERETGDAADVGATDAEAALIRSLVERHAAGMLGGRSSGGGRVLPGRFSRFAATAAAAAVLLLGVWLAFGSGGETAPGFRPDPVLGGGERSEAIVYPRTGVPVDRADFYLEHRLPAAPNASLEVTVYVDASRDETVLGPETFLGSRWEPTAAQLASLPQTFVVDIRYQRTDGSYDRVTHTVRLAP